MILIANWKMMGDLAGYRKMIDALPPLKNREKVIICPSYAYGLMLKQDLEAKGYSLGAQDCSAHEEGNFTGQVSCHMLQDIGVSTVILGHSERRQYVPCTESHDALIKKITLCEKHSLQPIFCVGEDLASFEKGRTKVALYQQLCSLMTQKIPPNLRVAYEPIWAIGKGVTPDHQHIEQVFSFIQTLFSHHGHTPKALLYGGSVNAKTLRDLKKAKGTQGFLIGKASLDTHQFPEIITQFFE